ncbi:MAG: hypothetical protein JNM98_06130 [Rhodocyclaceae bacterium]|nr:hypothetical protein [Rhodocyclaceae bacterium]
MSNPLVDLLNARVAEGAPPPALLPYQQRWVADKSPVKVVEKSRRIGLTWAEAADDALIASVRDGHNVFYISAAQDMAIEYIEAVAMWSRAFALAASEIGEGDDDLVDLDGKTVKTFKIAYPSDKRVVALSSRPANLRGKQGTIVLDEAAFGPDLPGLLKAAMAMLMWGASVRVLSTHNGVENPFNQLIQDIRGGRRGGQVHKITFEQAVSDGLYVRVCLRKGIPWTQAGQDAWVADVRRFYGADAAEELDTIPANSGGRYLSITLIESRQSPDTPVLRREWSPEFAHASDAVRHAEVQAWLDEEVQPILHALDPDRPHGLGEDFGRVADLSVYVVGEEGRDQCVRVRLQIELSCCPHRQQEQILKYIIDRLPRFRAADFDAGGNGSAVAEFMVQKYGAARIAAVQISEGWWIDSAPKFRTALEDRTYDCIPRDSDTRDDFRALQVINGVAKLPATRTRSADAPKQRRHGDALVAHMMLRNAMRRDVAPIDYIEVPADLQRAPRGRAADYPEHSGDTAGPVGTYGGSW